MSLFSDNSSPMENIARSASSPPPNESMINSEEILELPPFDSISEPSDSSGQMEEAFVPTGSLAYMSPEFLESKPISSRLYEGAAYNLRFVKKIGIPVRRAPVDLPDVMSIVEIIKNVLNLLTGGVPRKKLTPVEEEVEIRKSTAGAYQTIMKWKTLSVSLLYDILSRINMLEEDMQESQDKLLSSCSKYRETIGSLKTEFRSLPSFVAPNLRGTCQLHALMMREVDRGSDLERAQISTSSIFDTKNPTDGFLIGDATIHPLHGNTAKTSLVSFGFGNTTQTDKTEGTHGTQLCQQKDSRDRDRELEEYTKFAYWTLVLSYAILYALLLAHLGRNVNYASVMKGVHIWSIIMMMSIYATSFIRCSCSTLKVVHISTAGLLFISSLFVFCLLQLTL